MWKAGVMCIAELTGCDVAVIGDPKRLQTILREASEAGGATVLNTFAVKTYSGPVAGATLAESHVVMRVYASAKAAFVEVFTCGDKADTLVIMAVIIRDLGAGGATIANRGCTRLGGGVPAVACHI